MAGETCKNHGSIRIISANLHRNRALHDPESMELLLPPDEDIPTIATFQEAFPWTADVAGSIEQRGYQAVLPESPFGLAFALSPHFPLVEAGDIEEFPFEYRGIFPPNGVLDPKKRFGIFVLNGVRVGGHAMTIAGSQEPAATSPWRPPAVTFKMDVMTRLARRRVPVDSDGVQHSQPILVDAGDRNHLYPRQIRSYHRRAAQWGGIPLFRSRDITYLLRNNPYLKHHAKLGLPDLQLDGMHVRFPEDLRLVPGQTGLESGQVSYETRTLEISSDHLALEALLHVAKKTGQK